MTGRNLPLVILWMSGALLSFSASAISIRILARTLGIFEILSLRSASGILILGAAALLGPGGRRRLAYRRPVLQLLRSGIHTIGQASWSYAITVLPLATVFALEFTSPIWLSILAVLFLGERLTVARVGAVILGIAGVLIVLRPGLSVLQPASGAALLAAVAFAITGVATKALTATENTLAILFWMNVVQLPLNLLGADLSFPMRLEAAQAPAVVALGVTSVVAHVCLTQAYRYGDATVVIPLDFLRVPLIALVGWRFYDEPLDVFVFLGAATVIAGIVWTLTAEARRPPPTSSRTPGSAPAS